ncbi:MAG: Mov34/MPN/PAD-1 family protein [Alphaproteobacteria bacterium]
MIAIPAAILKQIEKAAEDAYPEECCGLLTGIRTPDGDVAVSRVATSPNVATANRQQRFEVDPVVRFELMRDLGGDGGDGPETIIGHYHSHPDHPARPSAHDLKMAFETDLIWLIVAVEAGRATDNAAWAVNGDADGFDAVGINSI